MTPYEEQCLLEEQIYNQTSFMQCPFCHATIEDLILDDYYDEAPPIQNGFVIDWTCDNCQERFRTYYKLDEDGCIIPPDPAIDYDKKHQENHKCSQDYVRYLQRVIRELKGE